MKHPRASRILVALVALTAVHAAIARAEDPDRVRIDIRLVDASSGKPTTAMTCIRDLATNSVRLPPDGRVARRVSQTRDFYRGIEYPRDDRGWIGPVRKTMGTGNNDDRSFVYELRPSVPYWREPVMFQTPGEFTIALEPGRYSIAVSHGMEFVPVRREIRVDAVTPQKIDISLERWATPAKTGWYSGDVHVHHPTLEAAHREFLLKYAEAEDLNVVNALEMGHHGGTEFKQVGFGKKHRVQRGNYAIVAGQEEPRSTFGHIIGLNLSALARDVPTYDFYDLAFQRIHAQKDALVGFAHFAWNGCALPRGFAWYATTGELDFIELMQFAMVNRADYYDWLNLGFRFVAAAGSDVPWGSTIGECRTYVYTGGDRLDIDAWFDGLRRGRTFVTNGPMLELTVDGELPGSELAREAEATVRIRARARGHADVGTPKALEVVGNDGVIRRAERKSGEKATDVTTLEVELDWRVDESRWIAASVECTNGASAHSTPVWVVIDERPTWSREHAPAVIAKQLAAIQRIDGEVRGRDDARSRGIAERLERARRFYADLGRKVRGE